MYDAPTGKGVIERVVMVKSWQLELFHDDGKAV
jgi:hypothetical protein